MVVEVCNAMVGPEGVYFAFLQDSGMVVSTTRFVWPSPKSHPSGEVEGWNQVLDKIAAVVAGLAQANRQVSRLLKALPRG
jgi:hypothetical protein